MANTKTNMITHGYHGKVGDQFVLRMRGGRSVIAAKPDRVNVTLSQAQKDHCKMFSGAVKYAKKALLDPVLRTIYDSKATNSVTAFNVAVADFLKMPLIVRIDATAYKGNIGDKIFVIADDNAKVNSLSVSICDENGTELESGLCQPDTLTTNWVYTASSLQAPPAGHTIRAIVHDLPGHVAELELAL